MRGPKPKYPIKLTTEEERELRRVANSRNAPLRTGARVV
jgi:hypothetical protein